MIKIPAFETKILFIATAFLLGLALISFPVQANAQAMINGSGGGSGGSDYDSDDIYGGGGGGVQGEEEVDGPMGNRFTTWYPSDEPESDGPSGGPTGDEPEPDEPDPDPGPEPDPDPDPDPPPEPDPCPSDGWFTTDTYSCSVCDGEDICTTCKDQEYRDYPAYEPCNYSEENTRTVHEDCSPHCGDDACNCGEDAASCPTDCNEPPYTEEYDVDEPADNQFCRASKGEIVVDYVPEWTFKDDNDDYDDTMQAYKIQLRDEADNLGKWEIRGLDVPDGQKVKRPLEVRTDDQLTSDPDESLHLEYNQSYGWRVDVQDSIGAWSDWSSWQNLSLSVKPRYPRTQFSFDPKDPVINDQISFDATDSEVYDGTQAQLSWDFDGDGAWEINNTTNKTATHTYAETGEYTITLRVEDNSPETSACTETKEIKVKPKQGRREEVIPR